MEKPYIAAADRNKEAIFEILKPFLLKSQRVLELGSGTGQHAVHFSEKMQHLQWQPTDLETNIYGIRQWVAQSETSNILEPFALDVSSHDWRPNTHDFVFTSNTTHFMPWGEVVSMFSGVSSSLCSLGHFSVYGPFHYEGEPISDGNKKLDDWLREQSEDFQIRYVSAIVGIARGSKFRLVDDVLMPSNNHLLIFQRQ